VPVISKKNKALKLAFVVLREGVAANIAEEIGLLP